MTAKMKRREFITLLGSAAAWPMGAGAQQPAMPVIGYLSSRSPDDTTHLLAGFRQGLAKGGFIEHQNVTIEYRWALGQYDHLPALPRGAVSRRGVAFRRPPVRPFPPDANGRVRRCIRGKGEPTRICPWGHSPRGELTNDRRHPDGAAKAGEAAQGGKAAVSYAKPGRRLARRRRCGDRTAFQVGRSVPTDLGPRPHPRP
jgi:hypothetical protein